MPLFFHNLALTLRLMDSGLRFLNDSLCHRKITAENRKIIGRFFNVHFCKRPTDL